MHKVILVILFCMVNYHAGYSQDTAGLIYSGFYFEDTAITGFPNVEILDSSGMVCRAVYYKQSFKTCRLKPGLYTVIASHPAYHTIRITNVRVRADQITFQDIKFLNIYKRQAGEPPKTINVEAVPPKVKVRGG